jgi:dienelactone hydrolase
MSLCVACTLLPGVPAAFASGDELVSKARNYAEYFMAGSFQKIESIYTPEMKAAMTRSASAQLRESLIAGNGALVRVGRVWFEDKVQVYVRYRAPLVFENATVDMRIVFDANDRVAGMFIVAHSDPPPDKEAPGIEIDVTVGESDAGLPGTLTLPPGEGPFPAAVLVHGSGPNDRDETIGPNKPFRDLAWGLAERGIATLRYDKRSLARPQDLIAVGEDLTVREEVIDDALAGLQLLRNRPEINPGALFVVGHSLGGALAPRIAEFEPRPAGVVVLAGSTLPLPEKMLEQYRYIASLDGVTTHDEQEQIDKVAELVSTVRAGLNGESVSAGYYLGVPIGYFRNLEAVDAPALLASIGAPALILQGGRDYQVTLDDFQRWRHALKDEPQACLRVFDDLDHLFRAGVGPSGPGDYDTYKPMATEVVECVAGFIRARHCCR